MRVTPHEGTICQHFQRAAELVGQRWVPQVIYVLMAGPARYSDIHAAIPGISDAMLSDRLKDLESAKVITREVTPATPVRISYALTARGEELAAVLGELQVWAERWARTAPNAPAVRTR